jgi:hypothetical protein
LIRSAETRHKADVVWRNDGKDSGIMGSGKRGYDAAPDTSPPLPNEAVAASGARTKRLGQITPGRSELVLEFVALPTKSMPALNVCRTSEAQCAWEPGLVIFSAASTTLDKPLQQRNHHS